VQLVTARTQERANPGPDAGEADGVKPREAERHPVFMRFHALACDYDGTLALDGRVDEATVQALRNVRESGRRLLLVTGRLLDDLKSVFPEIELFDWVIAENGALLLRPETGEEVVVADPPPPELVATLRRRKVKPISTGRVIVATWQPHETTVLEAIRDLGLERQVIFNKGAVMVLPSGINKATGLALALDRMDLSAHNLAGIGDAENDHAFLSSCELSAAVSNALPTVKQAVDVVMKDDHGAGVVELIRRLLNGDLEAESRKVTRHLVSLGATGSGAQITVPCSGSNLLFTGTAGAGKSTLAKVFLQGLADQRYQFCVVDPEGDYEEFEEGVVLGDRTHAPSVTQVLEVLRDPDQNAVVNLLGMPLEDRPRFFGALFGELLALRARTGRPHWIVLDEAHHLLPRDAGAAAITLPKRLTNMVYVTISPGDMIAGALRIVDRVFGIGEAATKPMTEFARAVRKEPPSPSRSLHPGEAFAWRPGARPRRFLVSETRFKHRRHRRKYAEGDLGPDLSFYFRGADGKLNLRAQNLVMFAQIASGLDADTWRFHLKRGDYSNWFRDVVKDEELVHEAEQLRRKRISPEESRKRLLDDVNLRYTGQPVPNTIRP
jgi:HAD superfamily hydrolase (TIGR01484 family)